jgi:hypothetical protein
MAFSVGEALPARTLAHWHPNMLTEELILIVSARLVERCCPFKK